MAEMVGAVTQERYQALVAEGRELVALASRWPAARRAVGVSHTVHAILASIEDEQERWAAINDPPLDERTGRRRWTTALAQRRVGHSTGRPESMAGLADRNQDDQASQRVAARPGMARRPARLHVAGTVAGYRR